jgi:hypothetical protein
MSTTVQSSNSDNRSIFYLLVVLAASIVGTLLLFAFISAPSFTFAASRSQGEGSIATTKYVGEPTPTVAPACGLRWRVIPSAAVGNPNSGLGDVEVIAANDIWAVGNSYDPGCICNAVQTLIEHWNGTQWSIVPSPNLGTSNFITGISAVAANDVWAVGYYYNDDGSGGLMSMHWTGAQWDVVPVAGRGTLNDVVAISADDVWAVGGRDTNTLILHWDGSQWSSVPSPTSEIGAVLFGITALSANNIWAVGYYSESEFVSKTLVAHWNGSQWSQVASPSPGTGANNLFGVDAVSASDIWAVGEYWVGSDGYTLALRWNGSQWNVIPGSIEGALQDVTAIAANDVWLVGGAAAGPETLTQHWNGTGLMTATSASTGVLYGVEHISPNNIWAVGVQLFSNDAHIQRYYDPCGMPSPTATPTITPVASPTPAPSPTPCTPGVYSDVPPGSTFYPYVSCLSTRGIIGGYGDCTFRPNANVTRGQLSKIVANAAGFNEPVSGQTFEDVPPTNAFYEHIERMAARGIIGGYPCGGPGEPCGTGNKPYFRPNANATRGQISKIVSQAKGYTNSVSGQTFEDVSPTNSFYLYVERLASRGIMGGYPCGGAGEPCGVGNRPYFRPGNNATRGQTSKIVSNTFFPNCQTSDKP